MARATVTQALANEANDPLTQSKLKELLDYNPETGVFIWKVAPPRKPSFVGKVAGCDSGRGHRIVKINQRIYFMHRLAWLYSR